MVDFCKAGRRPRFLWRGFQCSSTGLAWPDDRRDKETTGPDASSHTNIDFTISLATANVLSLGKPDQGHAGKTAFLRKQFADLHLNFLGLQETRADNGASQVDGVLRLSSGHDKGIFGVELWCNLHCPIGYIAKAPVYLQKSHFNVAHHDSRRILVHIACPYLHFWILVAHAPQSGKPFRERQEWWTETQTILDARIKPAETVFVCLDANAPPGPCYHRHVFSKGFASASGTALLRKFCDHFDLCLPSTSGKHSGGVATWTAPDGLSSHVIDDILSQLRFLMLSRNPSSWTALTSATLALTTHR